jgi:hypothetical protein
VKGRQLRANPRAALAVDVEVYPYQYVVARGPVSMAEHAPDLLAWATRIAARYVPAGRAEEYGRRYVAMEEMLCRLRIERISGARNVTA